jgi:hypothetical protein
LYCDSSEFYAVTKAFSTANLPDTLVLRDGSGNFSAGAITATTFSGQLAGTIASATTATTQAPGDNTTKVATTAFVENIASTLGTMSTQNANNVNITGGSIAGITDLAVADGGTGSSTLSANAVLLGNGTSALQTVAPGTANNVLVSNGTTWTSSSFGLGYGQTWQNVTRTAGVTYTNSTGKPICLAITSDFTVRAFGLVSVTFGNGVTVGVVGDSYSTVGQQSTGNIIIPIGETYTIVNSSGIPYTAQELR